MKRIGGIYACIDGDHRYRTDIGVYASESWDEAKDGSFIEIRLVELAMAQRDSTLEGA